MKFHKQSAKFPLIALPMLVQAATSTALAQAPAPPAFGAPREGGAFGAPRTNSPFGRTPGTTGAAPGNTGTAPAVPTVTGKVVPDVPTTYLWDSGGQVAISRVGTWGNGVGAVTRALTYNGDDVLEMTTRNFNEGVMFEFTPPVNLADYKQEGYVRLRLRFQESLPATSPGSPGFGGEGGFGSESGSGAPFGGAPTTFANNQTSPRMGGRGSNRPSSNDSSMMQRGSSPGFGAPPGGFTPPGSFRGEGGFGGPEGMMPGVGMGLPMGPLPQTTKIRRMMVTFVMEKGIASGTLDLPSDLSKIEPDDAGWRLFLMPVKDLKFTEGASGMAQRMILTSDQQDTFYMAQSALVVETGQMSVNIRRPTDPLGTQVGELTIKPGLITLVADVEAGTADPLIEWNFDANNVNPEIAMKRAAPLGGAPGAFSPEGGFVGAPANPEGGPAGGFGGAPGGFGAPPAGGFGAAPGQFGAPGGLFGNEGGPAALPLAPSVDARGLVAKFEYPNEEMDYRAEVTVTDRAGKKAPVKASILIKVRS